MSRLLRRGSRKVALTRISRSGGQEHGGVTMHKAHEETALYKCGQYCNQAALVLDKVYAALEEEGMISGPASRLHLMSRRPHVYNIPPGKHGLSFVP